MEGTEALHEEATEAPRHTLGRSVFLHLAPGALIALAYVVVGLPVARAVGYPTLFGFFLAGLLVLLPWELGYLLYLGKQRTGRWTLEGIALYRNSIPPLLLIGCALLVIVIAIATVTGLSGIDSFILTTLFSWVPDWYQLVGFEPPAYPMSLYRIVTPINILFFGIAFPWIEELYFRGYLLPRIAHLGWKAPVLNAVLFALYHMWTPWLAVTRAIFVLPMVWLVHRYQSIRIGIWAHCTLNTLGIILTYAAIAAAG
jgi:membrane protease YdiL (CAAX protease family)